MLTPRLETPAKYSATPALHVEPRLEKLAAWLSELPLANPSESLRAMHDVLEQWNRIDIPYARRLALTEAMRPRLMELTPALRRDYIDTPLPLSARNQQRHKLMARLWTEVAHAYKLTVMELLLTEKEILDSTQALVPAIYRAVAAQTEQLAEAYAIYSEEPANTWLEIHQLFQYSHVNSIAEVAFATARSGAARQVTIGRAYRKALLLTLADPYHLTPGEVIRVAQELEDWDSLCDSVSMSKETATGRYYVDTELDAGPRYISDPETLTLSRSAWTIDLSPTVDLVSKRARATLDTGPRLAGQAAHTTLSQRQSRETYRRLAHAWTPRRPRNTMRSPTVQQIMVTTGLSAAHHLASGRQPFQPEVSEGALGGGAPTLDRAPALTLEDLPEPTPPAGPAPGGHSARLARIDMKAGDAQPDAWDNSQRAASNKLLVQHIHESEIEQPSATATVRDASPQGLALDLPLAGSVIHTRVGDLVALVAALPLESPTAGKQCRIGAVRWLRTTSAQRLELGIEVLSEDALPVATRAIDGVGKGSEYFRGLIVPRRDPEDRQTTLITMPSIYDVGTILVVNTGQKLYQARLTRLIEGAGSFARFQFELKDASQSLGWVS